MKSLILSFILFVAVGLNADMTNNGVFCVDTPCECRAILQNGATTTNQLIAGKTYTVGNMLFEILATNRTMFYFSSGLVIYVSPQSTMTINLFDQEVKNLDAQPRKAEFGSHNLSLVFNKGTFFVAYPSQDSNSTFAISTPLAMYQMNPGKFVFQISEQKSLVYVIDGMLKVHGDKTRIDLAKRGNKVITGQIDTEVATTTRNINQTESKDISSSQSEIDTKSLNVQFYIVNGQVIGIWMNKSSQKAF